MPFIRPLLASVAALSAAVGVGIGATHLLQPEYVDVAPVIMPANPAPAPEVPQPSGGSPAVSQETPCDDDPNNCVDPSCVSPGNPAGVCWYDGHQFPNRTICLQSGPSSAWTQAAIESTLNWVAYQWAVNGPRIYVRSNPGACAADGFVARQIVKFVPYSANDGHCGLSYSMGVGYSENLVTLNVHPTVPGGFQYDTLCRSGSAFNVHAAHEFGHQLGLTHYAEWASLMQGGTYRSSIDAWKMQNLYTGNPCGDPLYAGCI